MIAGHELSLGALTVIETLPPEVIDAAADAGFDAVGLRIDNLRPGVDNPLLNDTPLRRRTVERLRDRGLRVLDVEITRLAAELERDAIRRVCEAAAVLEARFMLVVGGDGELPRAAENFAAVCELAEPYGLKPALEFMPFAGVKTPQQADAIVEAAGHPSGTVLVDSLHVWRSGSSPAEVASLASAHPERFGYTQLCDAPLAAPADGDGGLYREAAGDRLAPGEGELGLRELVAALPAGIPIGVEAPVVAWAGLDAAQRARRTMAGLQQLLA